MSGAAAAGEGWAQAADAAPLVAVRGLGKRYGAGCEACASPLGVAGTQGRCGRCGAIWACADIDLEVDAGEILGIVGESGSGKSTLARCLYFDETPTLGTVHLAPYGDGEADLLTLSVRDRRYVRDNLMGMVYQNPLLGLRMDATVGGNVAEKLLAAGVRSVGAIRERAAELLSRVEIPLVRIDETPRAFSGGMQQRVQIAKALANRPPLLLLDEVTTGLDLSVQARVLDLILEIRRDEKVGMLVISHDLAVIRMLADRTLVMRHGRVLEQGLTDQILEDPEHPYTQLLVHSLL